MRMNDQILTHRIIVCGLVGFTFLLSILTIIGLIVINKWVLVSIISIVVLIYSVKYFRDDIKSVIKHIQKRKKSLLISKEIFAVVIILLFFVHLSQVVEYYGFPPAGDLLNHGVIVSLAIDNEKLPLTFAPIEPLLNMNNPFGFHAMTSFFATLFNIYPANAIFILGSFVTGLVFIAVFSLTYHLTKSISIALLGAAFVIWVNPTGNLLSWLMGYFYNGPYPNIAGYVLVLTSFLLYTISIKSTVITRDRIYQIQIVLIFSLLVTYTLFALIPILFLLLMNIIDLSKKFTLGLRNLKNNIHKLVFFDYLKNFLKEHKLFFILLLVLSILTLAASQILLDPTNSLGEKFSKVYERASYGIEMNYFSENYAGILSIIAVLASIGMIIRRKQIEISIIQLFLFSIVFFSLFLSPLSVLLPIRTAILLSIVSWIVLILVLNEFLRWKKLSSFIVYFKSHSIKINYLKILTVLGVFFLVLFPSFQSHISGEIADNYDWFTRSEFFQNDYPVMEWISHNVSSTELILNDFSVTSLFIQSFSVQNVTSNRLAVSDKNIELAKDSQQFWRDPMNSCTLSDLIKKHDIKYIHLTNEWGFYDFSFVGGNNTYIPKPYDRTLLYEILSNTTFLNPKITSSYGGLFEVVSNFSKRSNDEFAFELPNQQYWKDFSNPKYETIFKNFTTLVIVNSTGQLVLNHEMISQDWSEFKSAEILWKGTNSGNPITIHVVGPSSGNYFSYKDKDDTIDWKKIKIPLQVMPIKYVEPSLDSVLRLQVIMDAPIGEYEIGKIILRYCG